MAAERHGEDGHIGGAHGAVEPPDNLGGERRGDQIVGDEAAVTEQIAALDVAGATEFVASIYGERSERERTFDLLAGLAKAAR